MREVGEENQGRKVLEILVFLSHFSFEIEADQNKKKKMVENLRVSERVRREKETYSIQKC